MASDPPSRPDPSSQRSSESGEGTRSRTRLFIPCATVFASSFCVMVIELVAGRIIAGTLGSSLYTWTSVIGIVLAGLALGNYAGGRLADRFDARKTLAVLFVASSAAALTISVSDDMAASLRPLWSMSWPLRVASHVALVFFIPSCLLGTISPVAAKMALDAGQATGRTIGSVYAWGVVGSILGTFATGFYLVAMFGTTAITVGVATVLAMLAVFYQVASWQAWAWMTVVAAIGVLTTNPAEATRTLGEKLGVRGESVPGLLYETESRYSKIRIVESQTIPGQREMYLDLLLHSLTELHEFLAWDSAFPQAARDFQPVARLREAAEANERELFEEIVGLQAELVSRANVMFAEYESTGKVSAETFNHHEAVIDPTLTALDEFVAVERSEVAMIYLDHFDHVDPVESSLD